MKLPITDDPNRSELDNLTPEHLAYLEELEAQLDRYNLGEGEKPEIAPNVRTILHHHCAVQAQKGLIEFYGE